MAERESNEQRGGRMIWEGLAAIQLLKHKAFNLTGSTPKLDILIRQLTLKGLHSSPVIYKEWSQYFWQDPFFLYALHGQRTERRQDGKKTINIHLRSNVLTLKKKKGTAGIEHQEFLLSSATMAALVLIIRYHQFPILICYELETVRQKSRSWYLLFSSHLNMFPDEDEGQKKRRGSSLEVLRHIQRLVHPLSSPSPDTCDESPLTAPTSLSVRQGPTPV